jgi:hypothetical protein
VVDAHHKPHGLTSLSRCHLSQVHKVQHKPRKKFTWGHKQIWSKGLESVLPVAHRTVSYAPVPRASEQATLGFLPGALRYNSPDCQCAPDMSGEPAEQRSLRVNGRLQKCMTEVRAAKSEVIGHVRCNYRTRLPTVNSLQTPTGALTWRAPDSEQFLSGAPLDCPVCLSPAKTTKG